MKYFGILAVAAALSIVPMKSSAKDGNGHTLTSLWKTYYSAENADKPEDQIKALERIKKEALAKELAWDYYDACETYVRVSTYKNWKLREGAMAEFRKEIESFPVPVAAFYMNRSDSDEELLEFVMKRRKSMEAGVNKEFYSRDYVITGVKYSDVLLELLENDYEYAMWHIYLRGGATDMFREMYAGRYPFSAFADYSYIKDEERREAALNDFVERYSGRAAALLAEEDLLQLRFEDLNRDGKGTSEDYLMLRRDCESFLKRAGSFSGQEKSIAGCCVQTAELLEKLESKRIGFRIKDGEFELFTKNLQSATVRLTKDKKTVFEKTLHNTVGSFYRQDTVKFKMTPLNDGDYEVECFNGKIRAEGRYEKYTISAAFKRDASGVRLYAADYFTGEPVKKAEVIVQDEDRKLVARSGELMLDGFTDLPEEINAVLGKRNSTFRVYVTFTDNDGRVRRSPDYGMRLYPEYRGETDESSHRCMIIADRTAFTPGETVHFKAVLYSGVRSLHSCGAGISLQARLFDAEGNRIAETDLKTNEFGSVAGDFVLKRGKKNGYYRIGIFEGDRQLQSLSLRVDDFVLPTYEMVWSTRDVYYLPLDKFCFKGRLLSYSGHSLGSAKVTYTLRKNWQETRTADLQLDADGNFSIEVETDDSQFQNYNVSVTVVDATGETMEFMRYATVTKEPEKPKEYFFEEDEDSDGISVRVVAGNMRTWAVAELYGADRVLLERRMVEFAPEGGNPASTKVSFPYKDSYPDVISVHLLYFQDSVCHDYVCYKRRPDTRYDLPLRFTRFLDTTAPGHSYIFTVQTKGNVEIAASVFDKSTENVSVSRWGTIRAAGPEPSFPDCRTCCGMDEAFSPIYDTPIYYKANGRALLMKAAPAAAANGALLSESVGMEDSVASDMVYGVAEEAAESASAESGGGPGAGYVRENFANTVAWEPFLRSDSNGEVRFQFTNADKLSTYYVQLFAHDVDMRNASIRREMVVTIPVKVAVVKPEYLYADDSYVANVTFSNGTDAPVRGTAEISFVAGTDHMGSPLISSKKEEISVPSSGSTAMSFKLDCASGDSLGILVKFVCEDDESGSDAVFVTLPVLKPEQTITEAHSSILLAGTDRQDVIDGLRSLFVNISGQDASVRTVSIRQMLQEAVPEKMDIRSENVISLLDSYYANHLLEKMGMGCLSEEEKAEIMEKVRLCRKGDGGYSWFAGMESSPIITAVVLSRLASMGMTPESESVRYLDTQFFSDKERPYWRGAISMEQYTYVRSLFPEVKFNAEGIDRKDFSRFRKDFRKYLVPAKVRGLNGQILAKTFRLMTMRNLLESKSGMALARDWGVVLSASARMERSLSKDLESLVQYAQAHKSGGWYYPNAVMPWRGLMESELYAHSLLCRLLSDMGQTEIANGIRLWMMVQKETQQWDQDSAFIEALAAVLSGPESILETEVISLSGSFTEPFAGIEKAGNGFAVERRYYVGDRELKDGDILRMGDTVRAEYRIYSEENRSFVVLRAPRPALLRPVNQLSGYDAGAYRSVLQTSTEYWFESFPEENTTVTEEFHVTQQGSFQSPVAEIECLYATHYRANDAGQSYTLVSQ